MSFYLTLDEHNTPESLINGGRKAFQKEQFHSGIILAVYKLYVAL